VLGLNDMAAEHPAARTSRCVARRHYEHECLERVTYGHRPGAALDGTFVQANGLVRVDLNHA
jgi:hypothetical protein